MRDRDLDKLKDDLFVLAHKQIPYAIRAGVTRQGQYLRDTIRGVPSKLKGANVRLPFPPLNSQAELSATFTGATDAGIAFFRKGIRLDPAKSLKNPTAIVGSIDYQLKQQEEGFTKPSSKKIEGVPVRQKAALTPKGGVKKAARLSSIELPTLKGTFKSQKQENTVAIKQAIKNSKGGKIDVIIKKGIKRGVFRIAGGKLVTRGAKGTVTKTGFQSRGKGRKKLAYKTFLPFTIRSATLLYSAPKQVAPTLPHKWLETAIKAVEPHREDLMIDTHIFQINKTSAYLKAKRGY